MSKERARRWRRVLHSKQGLVHGFALPCEVVDDLPLPLIGPARVLVFARRHDGPMPPSRYKKKTLPLQGTVLCDCRKLRWLKGDTGLTCSKMKRKRRKEHGRGYRDISFFGALYPSKSGLMNKHIVTIIVKRIGGSVSHCLIARQTCRSNSGWLVGWLMGLCMYAGGDIHKDGASSCPQPRHSPGPRDKPLLVLRSSRRAINSPNDGP